MPLQELAARLDVSTAVVAGHRAARRARTWTETSACSASGACSRRESTRTPTGCSSAASTSASASRGRSSAAPGTSAPARRSRSRCRAPCCRAGLKLERAKLRGEVSDGMILSERELELGDDHSGILVLAGRRAGHAARRRASAGRDRPRARDHGNRPDLLSVYGFAREVADAVRRRAARRRRARTREQVGDEPVDVRIEDYEGCPRYIGRLFRDVKSARRRRWLRARLTAAGMRPISNVVDVTNYVMLGAREPAARLRLRHAGRGPHRRPARAAGRGAAHARRRAAQARAVRSDDRRRRARGRPGRDHGRRGDGGLATRRRTSCSRRRTSSRSGSGGPPSGCGCAPRARTAGRRASTRTSPSRQPCSRRSCSSSSPAPAGRATPTSRATCRSGRSCASARSRPTGSSGSRWREGEQHEILERLGFELEGSAYRVPTWRARDLTREIDLVEEVARFVLADVPFTLPAPARDDGRLSPRAAGAPAARGRARRARLLRGVHAVARGRTTATRRDQARGADLDRARASCGRSSCRGSSRSPAATSRRATSGRAVRDRARLPAARRASCRTSGCTSPGSSRAASRPAKGVVEAIYGALKAPPLLRARRAPAPAPGQDRAAPEAGVVGELHPDRARGRVGRVRARPRRAARRRARPGARTRT